MLVETEVDWVPIMRVDELWEGDARDIEVQGEHVLVARLPGGRIVAFQGVCPHQEYHLIDSEFDWDKGVVTCGGHHWQFRLTDGQGINPAGCRLFQYEVRVSDGEVLLGVPRGVRRYNRCRK